MIDTKIAHPRTAILLGKRPAADLEAQIAAGDHPRVEYLELVRYLGAELLDFNAVEASTSLRVQTINRRLGPFWALAYMAFLRRREFDHFYATGEDIGIPLAMFLRMARWYRRLTVVVHNAGTPKRRAILQRLGHRVYRSIICLGQAQRRVLTDEIGLPASKVHMVDYWCDHQFFTAEALRTGEYILSLGIEQRDYATLQAAAQTLEYRFHVLASGWSPQAGFTAASGITEHPNITVEHGVSFHRLRELYAQCRFVVVPLKHVNYAVGVTSIVEAMAMSKAVIVSAAPGILDYIEDGVSGLLVPVGDAKALRTAIVELWEDPLRAAEMGRHNRRWVEQRINIDRYVASVADMLGISIADSPIASREACTSTVSSCQ